MLIRRKIIWIFDAIWRLWYEIFNVIMTVLITRHFSSPMICLLAQFGRSPKNQTDYHCQIFNCWLGCWRIVATGVYRTSLSAANINNPSKSRSTEMSAMECKKSEWVNDGIWLKSNNECSLIINWLSRAQQTATVQPTEQWASFFSHWIHESCTTFIFVATCLNGLAQHICRISPHLLA